MDAGADKVICKGKSVELQITNYELQSKYKWNTGDTTSSITFTPQMLKLYSVTATNNNCTAKDVVIVKVIRTTANAGYDKTICNGMTTTLTAFGGKSYQWTMDNGQWTMNTQSVAVAPTVRTTYTVIVTNDKGCSASDNIVVSVTGCKDNEKLIMNNEKLGFGIEDLGLGIYPNPNGGEFEIWFDGFKEIKGSVRIYDMIGNVVYEYEGIINKKIINLDEKEGVYFVKVETGESVVVRKVVLY